MAEGGDEVWLAMVVHWGVENNGVSALTAPSDSEAGENVSIPSPPSSEAFARDKIAVLQQCLRSSRFRAHFIAVLADLEAQSQFLILIRG